MKYGKIFLATCVMALAIQGAMAQEVLDSLEIIYNQILNGQDVENVKTKPDVQPQETASQRILVFGDSMLDGVGRRFNDYASANGHTIFTSIWYGSTTKSWAYTTELDRLLQKVNPTFVVVCLGTNDLGYRDISSRSAAVKEIIRVLGNIPFVWIGPVTLRNIKQDPGIVNMIRENVGVDRFYDSYHLKLARFADGIHPTFEASARWVDGVVSWMNSPEFAYRIHLDRPSSSVPFKNYETHSTRYKGKAK